MRATLLLLVLLLVLLPSCARMERARDCRRLTRMINAALDQIERREGQGPSRVEAYDSVARHYERLARELGQFKSKDQPLAQAVAEYQAFAQSAGHSINKAAGAMRFGNPVGLTEARTELLNQRQAQQALNRQIEQVCRAP
jgi:hypothetical protein